MGPNDLFGLQFSFPENKKIVPIPRCRYHLSEISMEKQKRYKGTTNGFYVGLFDEE